MSTRQGKIKYLNTPESNVQGDLSLRPEGTEAVITMFAQWLWNINLLFVNKNQQNNYNSIQFRSFIYCFVTIHFILLFWLRGKGWKRHWERWGKRVGNHCFRLCPEHSCHLESPHIGYMVSFLARWVGTHTHYFPGYSVTYLCHFSFSSWNNRESHDYCYLNII